MGTQREGWMRRMGEGWKKGWKEECDRWVVPGQSWEGAERLATQAWQRPLPHAKQPSAGARAPRLEPKLVSASQHVELACLGHSQMVLQLPLCPPSLTKSEPRNCTQQT
ncbi:hypothetical protein EYF80_015470 [Liparis tanakae]|uniref:Uncharacterized protein n=1 Tax=Liparis tanakae TaxID=230148 RepID=A0A4Z2I8A4_9TELE|nr:hypothetical protein EYF80_015470 [Liparis tanakae]